MRRLAASWAEALKVYTEPRVFLFLFLGFSSGLPLLLVYSTLSAWLSEEGVSLAVIGWFSLASTAYALKFVWSPVVDRAPLPFLTKRFGQRRGWLLASQAAVAAATFGLGGSDPAADLAVTAIWAVALAFASATQDIVVDALRIEKLDEERMGAGAANYVVGYRVATLVSGAGALILADQAGWFWAYAAMAGFVVVGVVATLIATEPTRRPSEETLAREREVDGEIERRFGRRSAFARFLAGAWEAVVLPFAEFLGRRHWLAILAFVALYKYGDALLGVMANPFYLDIGFTKTEIGLVSKGFGLAMSLSGGVAGGLMVARMGVMKALLVTGILQALSNLVFALQAHVGADIGMLFVTIGVENLTGGMGTIAFVAYLSGLCNVAYTATQYALLSSLMAFARGVLAAGGGWLAEQMDWVLFFIVTTGAAAPGLLLLLYLMRRLPPETDPRDAAAP